MRISRPLELGLALALLALAACQAEVTGSASATSPASGAATAPTAPGAPSGSAPASGGQCGSGAALPAPRAVLMPVRQYIRVLRDLLGEDAVADEDTAAAGALEFAWIDRPRVTTASLDQVLRLADRALERVQERAPQLLGCTTLDDRDCVRRGLGAIARRAFKRPVADDELDALTALIDQTIMLEPGAADAMKLGTMTAIEAIMVAPSTLYRSEFDGTLRAGGHTLSAHAQAAALAALLLDSVPDAGLVAAADDGSLLRPAGLRAQLDRLLGLPRVQQHVTDLLLHAFGIPKVLQTPKDSQRFPQYTPALQASMYEESRRFIDSVLWQDGRHVDELLTSRTSFVDAALAKLYGVKHAGSPEAFQAVELPPARAGLLTHASVLSALARTDRTSVVARGLFVRGAMLCLPKVPAPPAAIQAQVDAQLADDASQAELASYRAKTSPCNGCHAQFDRLGLALESFDAIGQLRDDAAMPIDLTGLAPLDGSIEDARQFAAQLVRDQHFSTCMSQRILAYAIGEPQERTAHPCAAQALADALARADGSMAELVAAVVGHPLFGTRSDAAPGGVSP